MPVTRPVPGIPFTPPSIIEKRLIWGKDAAKLTGLMFSSGALYAGYKTYESWNLPTKRGYIYDVGVPNSIGRRKIKWRYQVGTETYRGEQAMGGIFLFERLSWGGRTGGRAFQYHLNDPVQITYNPEQPKISSIEQTMIFHTGALSFAAAASFLTYFLIQV